ncbi:MAG TPA: zf-HC2 domain-containing protein [Thermoanaerobacterales bacterium]|jgi:predicted anti-sigma-YlaC factor YlaD|nr:zf-HC2 domain-containing protein [Thermoanaerobacterales bacterium]
MSCNLYEDLIMEYLDGELICSEKENLKSHLQECASCREFLSIQKKQHTMLRALPLFTPGKDFTIKVMKDIHRKKDALYVKKILLFLLMPLVLGIAVIYLCWPKIVLGISLVTVYAVNGIKMLITVTSNWIETVIQWFQIAGKILSQLWWVQRIIFKIILDIFNWHFLGYTAVALLFAGTFLLAKILPQHKQS